MINVHNSAARDSAVGALWAVGVLIVVGIAAVWAASKAASKTMEVTDETDEEPVPHDEDKPAFTAADVTEAFDAGRDVQRQLCEAAHGAAGA